MKEAIKLFLAIPRYIFGDKAIQGALLLVLVLVFTYGRLRI